MLSLPQQYAVKREYDTPRHTGHDVELTCFLDCLSTVRISYACHYRNQLMIIQFAKSVECARHFLLSSTEKAAHEHRQQRDALVTKIKLELDSLLDVVTDGIGQYLVRDQKSRKLAMTRACLRLAEDTRLNVFPFWKYLDDHEEELMAIAEMRRSASVVRSQPTVIC